MHLDRASRRLRAGRVKLNIALIVGAGAASITAWTTVERPDCFLITIVGTISALLLIAILFNRLEGEPER
jgi:hypothetical protein